MNGLSRESREAETFQRLHRLTKKGYVARLSGQGGVDDAIFLDHLGDGPELILYSDGTVVRKDAMFNFDEPDKDRIYNEDRKDRVRFDEFLATVRQPTWRERTRPDREKYIYTPGCAILMLAGLWLSAKIVDWAWQALTS